MRFDTGDAYLGNLQWTHRRAKELWYHHLAKNHLRHLGHLKLWHLILAITKKIIQPSATTKPGVVLCMRHCATTAITKANGT